jgi:DNA-binding SARP family transcriptional activator
MPAKLELSLLGTVAITLDGERVSGQVPAKSQALLCYLAVTGRRHSREKLAGLLWGDKPEARAKANLRKSLSSLRQWFEDALIITRQTVAFNHDSDYWLDVEAFESALAEDEPASEELQPLREAVDLYRGEFLEGFSVRHALGFEEWVLQERERLRQMAIEGLHRLSEVCTVRGEYAAGIEYTNRLLALEPWQEKAHRQLMTLLARSGQQSAALAQYETCRRILAEELGVEPLPETQALYHRLKTRREASPDNLPPQTTPFVGRQAELVQIAHHLERADCHLLTLIGAGGIGKTRLALQAAGQALDAFADGVYFVSLVGISSPEFLVPTIEEALGYPLSGEADPRRQLLNYLHQKEMLLVLDDFEHLLFSPGGNDSGRDLLLEMVGTAPKLKLLVTSRERLNLQAEWLLTLQGLPYPPAEAALGEDSFCLCRVRRGCGQISPCQRNGQRWCASAGCWTGCRWASNWRRPGCLSCRVLGLSRSFLVVWICCPRHSTTCRPDTEAWRRCSTIRGSFSPSLNGPYSRDCRCFGVVLTARQPSRLPALLWERWRRWSTNHCRTWSPPGVMTCLSR